MNAENRNDCILSFLIAHSFVSSYLSIYQTRIIFVHLLLPIAHSLLDVSPMFLLLSSLCCLPSYRPPTVISFSSSPLLSVSYCRISSVDCRAVLSVDTLDMGYNMISSLGYNCFNNLPPSAAIKLNNNFLGSLDDCSYRYPCL